MKFTAAITSLCLAMGALNGVAACNGDGCLRALLPTRDLARFTKGAEFCLSFLAGHSTTVKNAPTDAAKVCGTAPEKYSSACTCIPPLKTPEQVITTIVKTIT